MAVIALGHFVGEEFGELPAVDIFVALFALLRCLLEVHVGHLGLEVRRLVAVDASDRAVSAHQREGRGAVIEAIQFAPGLGVVAGLASGGLAVGGDFDHAIVELAVVRILVAAFAGEILEVIRDLRLWLVFVGQFVAVAARHG